MAWSPDLVTLSVAEGDKIWIWYVLHLYITVLCIGMPYHGVYMKHASYS